MERRFHRDLHFIMIHDGIVHHGIPVHQVLIEGHGGDGDLVDLADWKQEAVVFDSPLLSLYPYPHHGPCDDNRDFTIVLAHVFHHGDDGGAFLRLVYYQEGGSVYVYPLIHGDEAEDVRGIGMAIAIPAEIRLLSAIDIDVTALVEPLREDVLDQVCLPHLPGPPDDQGLAARIGVPPLQILKVPSFHAFLHVINYTF